MGMSRRWRKVLAGALATGLLLVAAGCGGGGSSDGQGGSGGSSDGGQTQGKKQGGILRLVDEPPNGPFGIPWEIISTGVLSAIPAFEPLLWMDWQGKIQPKLAERWESDPENKTITLYLRKGVKFHDGTEFNAEAVRYNLEHGMKKKLIPMLEAVEVVDTHTVRLKLNSWDNSVFLYLAGTQSVMASPTAIEQKGEEWAGYHPVGTGPFKFVSYERDAKTTYERFEDYWDQGKPYLDGIEIRYIRDPQTLKAAFLSGDIDMFGTGDTVLINELKAAGYPYIEGKSGIGISVLIPSSANEGSPLADPRVRKAISHAIDRKGLAEARGYGVVEPAEQLAAPGWAAYLEDYQTASYNPDEAKRLLAEAGYANGFSTKLIPAPWVDKDTVVALQQFLKQVGIQAEIETPDSARYREYQTKGWDGLLVQPWGYFANYNRFIQFYFLGGPEGFVSMKKPEELQRLWDESRSTPEQDPAKVQAVHRLLLDDMTVIPVSAASRYYFMQDYVKDTNHMNWASWPWWTPAEAWLDK